MIKNVSTQQIIDNDIALMSFLKSMFHQDNSLWLEVYTKLLKSLYYLYLILDDDHFQGIIIIEPRIIDNEKDALIFYAQSFSQKVVNAKNIQDFLAHIKAEGFNRISFYTENQTLVDLASAESFIKTFYMYRRL
jgi:hypothetical protein